MLDIALQFLRDELNSYILARSGAAAVEVKLTRVADAAGGYAFSEETIGISLINIEEERTVREQRPTHAIIDGQHVMLEPEIKLNLHVLFAANFKQYDQALKFIAHVITFFQVHPVFAGSRDAALDPRIEKMMVDLQSLNYEQFNQIWASIGAKQLPCVVYKVRMVVLQDAEPGEVRPSITSLATNIGHR